MSDSRHYNWVAACGGKEEPFMGADGKVYHYLWNGLSGPDCEHAYYCVSDDVFLDATECAGRVWPK